MRRTFFPDLPGTKCIGGVIWFPGGTGGTYPIWCDDESFPMPAPRPSSAFVRRPASAFIDAVAELGDTDPRTAAEALADAAGISVADLDNRTAGEVARLIIDTVRGPRSRRGSRLSRASRPSTVGSLVEELDFEAETSQVFEDLAQQTGLSVAQVRNLAPSELGDHLGAVGGSSTPTVMFMSGTTTVCGSSGGYTRCGVIDGPLEGILWGGIIGGAIGGGLGAVIGGIIGGLLDWIFGDDED